MNNSQTPAWCPGCGDFAILKTLDKVIDSAGIDRKRLVLVSGIGQAAKLPHYTTANVFNGLHGRALPAATGVKIANHTLEVIVTSGDGDMYGEGGNHLLNAMRRNIGVKAFVHNNQVYALTKGQASPTSEPGFVTKIQTRGVSLQPLNPLAIAIVEDCSFVARTTSVLPGHLEKMMLAALKVKGFALLDILQPCVSFNQTNTAKWYKDRCVELPETHDPANRLQALEASLQWGEQIPIGVLYTGKRKSFEETCPALSGPPLSESYR